MTDIQYEHIVDPPGLLEFCARTQGSAYVAFDTEFVSENRFRPQLCLIQVATPKGLAIIDTIAVTDLKPFWNLLTDDIETTIVHAAREEFLFCFRETGRRPKNLIDLQLAAAFVGRDYPAAYSSLVSQILGHRLSKGETRTDWRQRPLSKKQTQYALQDVLHLYPMYEKLNQELLKTQRWNWYLEEIADWQTQLERFEAEPQWQRLPGLTKLHRRELAVVRELFLWREQVAQERERSPRRILPDDLLIEIAKRGESQPSRLTAIRGLSQRVNAKLIPEIGEAVEKALSLPESQCPERIDANLSPTIGLLGQFLTTSLNLVCYEKRIAPGLVATAQDIRNLAAWKLEQVATRNAASDEAEQERQPPRAENSTADPVESPALLNGWRRLIIADLFDDVMNGRVALRVGNPKASNPVRLERWPNSK